MGREKISEEEKIQKVKTIIDRIFEGISVGRALAEVRMGAKEFCLVLDKTPILAVNYGRARQFKADRMADDIVDIADTESDPIKGRNRIDARRWLASKLKPSEYADRLDVNLNQTIDIGQALTDARNRALPMRDLAQPQLVQPLETSSGFAQNKAGLEPVVHLTSEPAATKCADDDHT